MEDVKDGIERLRGMGWYIPDVSQLSVEGEEIKRKDGKLFVNARGDKQLILRLKKDDTPSESPVPASSAPSDDGSPV